MAADLTDGVRRVREALASGGYEVRIVELELSARSAVEAAQAIGCEVAQIAKSILFRARSMDTPVLVVASGSNRIREDLLEALVGEPLGKADADYVRSRTGFAIGGVPPFAHLQPVRCVIDEDLLRFTHVWAAAGHPRVVFEVDPLHLPRMTGGTVTRIV